MTFTASQLRAARGLLDWSRQDLAKAANVSTETIKNIEYANFRPQEVTIDAIIRAFAAYDVEFSADEGVRKSRSAVVTYDGIENFKRYVDESYKVLSEGEYEKTICIFANNDQAFFKALGDYAQPHIQRMNKLENLKFRALVLDGTKFIPAKYIEYRRLPNIAYAIPFSVYGDRFDFIIYGEGKSFPRVIVIKSQVVADAYRAQFDELWKVATPFKA